MDIFDESDAILSHDFQLVYALGNQVPVRTLEVSDRRILPDFEILFAVNHVALTVARRASPLDSSPSIAHRTRSKQERRYSQPYKGPLAGSPRMLQVRIVSENSFAVAYQRTRARARSCFVQTAFGRPTI